MGEPMVVVVAGGASGIGLAIARAALACEARVWIVGRSPERLEAAGRSLAATPGELLPLAADITSEPDVARLFETVGKVNHLVVTAADVVAYQPVAQLDLGDAMRTIRSKLIGPILLAKHAASQIAPRGSITFTGGIAAERPIAGGSVVAAVNAGLCGLTRALSLELAPIRVNTLSPGWVDTPIWDTIAGPNKHAVQAQMAERIPVGRIASADDIAEAAVFLMRSPHMTGSVLQITGGQHLV